MSDAQQRSLAKMAEAGLPEEARTLFAHYHALAESGETGLIPEETIEPLTEVQRLEDVRIDPDAAREALGKTVVLRLNGGLGTSMGLDRAKTLLPVREGLTFLDLIARQILHAREAHGVRLPVLFMNSFRTRTDTLEFLARYPDLATEGLPLDFVQSRIPKVRADDLTPVEWPADPALEWCPPGHGEVYAALHWTGTLDTLLEQGFEYLSLANGDNLGAAPTPELAGWFAQSGAPYAAELCRRTANDRKGGHLALRRADGQLILRDTAQTPKEQMDFFTDEHRHPFFHTNNLWVNLRALAAKLDAVGPVLGLPLIRNTKTVDPTDPDSPAVLQLETAMGAAVAVFEGATAILVGRDRFLPVKTTNELLLVRSDAFELADDGRLLAAVEQIPGVDLDSRFYKLVDDFDERMRVVPSLREADSLTVRGDWTFDAPTRVLGTATLEGEGGTVPAGTVLGG